VTGNIIVNKTVHKEAKK